MKSKADLLTTIRTEGPMKSLAGFAGFTLSWVPLISTSHYGPGQIPGCEVEISGTHSIRHPFGYAEI